MISIIIPVKNGAKYIKETLNRIYQQKIEDKFEIIVIDSGSTDGTIEMVRAFPDIQLIQIPAHEFGHGRTRNLGAKTAKGEYLVYLNSDAWPADDNWLNNLVKNFKGDLGIAGIYSRHIPRPGCYLFIEREIKKTFPEEKYIKDKNAMANASSYKKDIFGSKYKLSKLVRFSTVSAAIRREVWERIPFDSNIISLEDQDWASRVLLAGYKIVYEPTSMVIHSHNYGFLELAKLYFIDRRVLDRIINKKYNGILFALPFLLVESARNIYLTLCRDFPYILMKKIALNKKIKEMYIAIVSRIMIVLGKEAAVFLHS